MRRNITTFEGSCLVAGTGIGGGIMAMPYLINKTGYIPAIFIMIIAYFISLLLHLMIAEILEKSNNESELLSVFKRYIFKNKFRKPLTWLFFILLLFTLYANLSGYIAGGAEIISGLLIFNRFVSIVVFYLLASVIVLFGVKTIAIGEKAGVLINGVVIMVLVFFSFSTTFHTPNLITTSPSGILATYGMMMFALSAFFGVPILTQAMDHNHQKIKKSIQYGLLINWLFTFTIATTVLFTTTTITKVAVIGWSQSLGSVIEVLASFFIIIAMFTSYWTFSKSLSDMVLIQLKTKAFLSWLVATAPTLFFPLFLKADFLELLRMAAGAIAVLISVMVIPTYVIAIKGQSTIYLKRFGKSRTLLLVVLIGYLLMAVGSLITI